MTWRTWINTSRIEDHWVEYFCCNHTLTKMANPIEPKMFRYTLITGLETCPGSFQGKLCSCPTKSKTSFLDDVVECLLWIYLVFLSLLECMNSRKSCLLVICLDMYYRLLLSFLFSLSPPPSPSSLPPSFSPFLFLFFLSINVTV